MGERVSQIPDLSEKEWEDLHKRLTLHAANTVFHLWWRGIRNSKGASVPGGLDPADIASEAIMDFIAGKRTWNSADQPDLLKFLKGVVDSKVSHLVESAENRKTRSPKPWRDHDGQEHDFEFESKESSHETLYADKEFAAAALGQLRAAIDGDAPVERLLDCMEAGFTTPAEIAELLGVTVKEINNSQKRLRTQVEKVRRSLGIGAGSRR